MIRNLVAFSLNNRFVVLSLALLLFAWGAVAFKALPVEAYPDVANVWVQVITQWPGRAAEEVEQQVTVPIEIQMNGMPHVQHVRSASLPGASVVVAAPVTPERRPPGAACATRGGSPKTSASASSSCP